jgi:hypothetical protein
VDSALSPSYSHEKLENPSFVDLVDVFEDLWRHCVLAQAKLLLGNENGDIAAMTVLCPYFEAITAYLSGEDSNRHAKEFFIRGFSLVFKSTSSEEIQKAAEAIYKNIRCGLAHDGMLSHKVNYSRLGSKAFFLTYRKNSDGSLDIPSGVVSIVVNPLRMYEGIVHHFDEYIRLLRAGEDQTLVDAFKKTVERQWALGTRENIIGMTEDEFLGRT